MRKTKIVCTLGPSSNDPLVIGKLIDAGMNVARLNFSHGDHQSHRALFQRIRKTAKERGQPLAILQDLQGPKIRVGALAGGSLDLTAGEEIEVITAGRNEAVAEGVIPCTYASLAKDVAPGDRILLDDGRLELRVIESRGDARVRCEIVTGGPLSDHKGINLPGVNLSTPALTDKDKADLTLGVELGVDAVALSFVRSADDCRQALALMAPDTPLIAKIEKPEAVEHVATILDQVAGVMVARGDLGVEIGVEFVPMVQKMLIEETNKRSKLVITATEMLDSMRHSPRPTRAEASDVANAILDGTDAVMLSGETASGEYPVRAVQTMDRIIRETEASPRFLIRPDPPSSNYAESTFAVARAAVAAAKEIRSKTIICFTESGRSPSLTSEYRPGAEIVAVTTSESTYRRLAMQWGVTPLLLDHEPHSVEETVAAVCALAVESGHAKAGDDVVVTLGSRSGGASDLMKVQRL